jgi:uncharacterized membrane protein YfcA
VLKAHLFKYAPGAQSCGLPFPARDTDDDATPTAAVTPLLFTITIALISISAGALGALAGVGGGIIIVPALTLLMGVDIRHAIAASIISVIATSSGAASSYVRERITNIRLAMVMEIATALGALCGAFLVTIVSGRWLYLLFGGVLCYTAWSMSRKNRGRVREPAPDPWADRLKLHGSYFDRAEGRDSGDEGRDLRAEGRDSGDEGRDLRAGGRDSGDEGRDLRAGGRDLGDGGRDLHAGGREIAYRVSRTKLGLAVSYVAGVASGLLGIGGGVLKVPVMNLAMGLPIKVCTATSNFMIGVTAATSAAVYFMRGDIKPFIAAPVAVGVIIGAKIGARLLGRLKGNVIRITFVVVLALSAVQMLRNGIW